MPSLIDPKSPWASKTLWINGLTVLVACLTAISGLTDNIPAEWMPYIVGGLAIANFALRFLTKGPLALIVLLLCLSLLVPQGAIAGSRHSSLYSPSAVKSPHQGAVVESGFFGPRSEGLSAAVEGDEPIVALVAGLLGSSRPNAVVGTVPSVVDLPFQGVATGWPRSHVGDECSKAGFTEPLRADANSSTAVVRIASKSPVVATRLHIPPDTVLGAICPRHSVRDWPSGNEFPVETSATAAITVAKVSCLNNTLAPAQTAAAPESVRATASSFANNSQSLKCATAQVLKVISASRSVGRSHEMLLSRQGRFWLEPADVCASVRLASFYSQALYLVSNRGDVSPPLSKGF